MAENAAVGSSKNMIPSWLTATSKGSGPRPSVCTSLTTKSMLSTPAAAARSRASSTSGAEMSYPTTRPVAPTAPATAIVCAPPPHPMSATRWPGAAPTDSSRWGVSASVRRSRLGHEATHCSWFQRVDSFSLATAPT